MKTTTALLTGLLALGAPALASADSADECRQRCLTSLRTLIDGRDRLAVMDAVDDVRRCFPEEHDAYRRSLSAGKVDAREAFVDSVLARTKLPKVCAQLVKLDNAIQGKPAVDLPAEWLVEEPIPKTPAELDAELDAIIAAQAVPPPAPAPRARTEDTRPATPYLAEMELRAKHNPITSMVGRVIGTALVLGLAAIGLWALIRGRRK